MDITTISNFRKQAKKYFNQVVNDQAPLLITRSDGVTIVAVPLEQYNSMVETDYLLRSPANKKRLEESIAQVKAGNVVTKTLEELKAHEQEN
jgi:antitoxin YefM